MAKSSQEWFREKLAQYGHDPKSLCWKDLNAQHVRYEVMRHLLMADEPTFSVYDYGCGLGDLADWLEADASLLGLSYYGYDNVSEMVEQARRIWAGRNYHFSSEEETRDVYDYVVALGTFNLRIDDQSYQQWNQYVEDTLLGLWRNCKKGMAFSLLTTYHDYEDVTLRYADPAYWLSFCLSNLSPYVSLATDYGQHEFTIAVRKEPRWKV